MLASVVICSSRLAARVKARFPLVVTRKDRLEISTCEGWLKLSGLETKLERQGSDVINMCKGGTVEILDKLC